MLENAAGEQTRERVDVSGVEVRSSRTLAEGLALWRIYSAMGPASSHRRPSASAGTPPALWLLWLESVRAIWARRIVGGDGVRGSGDAV